MSPHAMNTFVSDLVQMAQAVERLPQVELELAEAHAKITDMGKHIEMLELRAHDRKVEIDKLHSRIRELEVAKDQAETMFLEADDRTARALDFIKSSFGAAGSLIQALEPPKAEEPQPQPQPQPPAIALATEAPSHVAEQMPDAEPKGVQHPPYYPQEGQSEPVDGQSTVSDASTATRSADNTTTELSPLPYAGKRYSEVSGHVSYSDWLNGGGTDHDYFI